MVRSIRGVSEWGAVHVGWWRGEAWQGCGVGLVICLGFDGWMLGCGLEMMCVGFGNHRYGKRMR